MNDRTPGAGEDAPYSVGYTRYVMWLLMIMLVVNFLDRQIINILAEPIKHDLGLADWQVGIMTGLAFAIFYTLFGLPVASLADRMDRSRIIGVALIIWSFFTAGCSLAQNFTQMLLFRIGVGVGEAGGTPPAHSLIVDVVPESRRAFWLAFYSVGNPLGALLGMVMGGVVGSLYGWRTAFLIAGVPGVVLGLLVLTTVRDPRAAHRRRLAAADAKVPNFSETIRFLKARPTFVTIAVAAALKSLIGYGNAPFSASFFLRTHPAEIAGMADWLGRTIGAEMKPIGFLGLTLGLGLGISGIAGTLLGGYLADRLSRDDVRGYMTGPAYSVLAAVPVSMAAYLVDSAAIALSLLCVSAFLTAFWYGPVFSTAQALAVPAMRAKTAALLLLIVNLLGLGLGPLFTGALSDVLNHAGMGEAGGLRMSLVLMSSLGVLSFIGFLMARRTIAQDIQSTTALADAK